MNKLCINKRGGKGDGSKGKAKILKRKITQITEEEEEVKEEQMGEGWGGGEGSLPAA